MLRSRVLTAVVLAPAVVAAILWLPTAAVAAIWGALLLVGALEWCSLAGLRAPAGRVLAVVLAAALGYAGWQALPQWLLPAALLAAVWWPLALLLVVRAEAGGALPGPALRVAAGVATLLPAALALVWLHGRPGDGPLQVLLVLVLVWAADIGAYFAGRRYGRRKLAPRVSPGKTVEGVWGALAASVVVAAAFALADGVVAGTGWWLLCAATVLVSVLGDLSESLFKRAAGVKDSGTLFPGHGGVLDRIDSLTAALPVYALGLALLERAA